MKSNGHGNNRHIVAGTVAYRKDITDRLLLLETESRGLKEDFARFIGRFDAFVEQISDWRQRQGKINWPVVLGMLGVLVTTVGIGFTVMVTSLSVFWFMINSNVANVITPLKTEQAANSAQVASNSHALTSDIIPRMAEIISQNARSIQDREDLNKSVNDLRSNDQRIDNGVVSIMQGLKEIETQFRANDEARNIQFAEQQRTNANFQNSLNGLKAPMPTAPTGPFYHPSISTPHDGNNK